MDTFAEPARRRRRPTRESSLLGPPFRSLIVAAASLAVLGGCSASGSVRRSATPPPPLPVEAHPSVVAVLASGGCPGVVSSGFVVGPGVVVTCRHGIEGRSRRSIRLFEGKRVPVRDVLAESPDHDLAALDVGNEVSAPALRFAARPPRVGDSVRVVWAKNSRTQRTDRATVSREEESLPRWGTVFRIRASLDLGCSGAPVLDERGDVVGVVIAGSPERGFFYVVPARLVSALVDGVTARPPAPAASPEPAVAPRAAR